MIPFEELMVGYELIDLIDWTSDDVVNDQNTEKVLTFIERCTKERKDFIGGYFKDEIHLKGDRDSTTLMTHLKEGVLYKIEEIENHNKLWKEIEDSPTLSDDEKGEMFGVIGLDGHYIDKDFGRWIGMTMLDYFCLSDGGVQ